MINIEKVAKEAGVSTATVSRVLNKSPLVSPKTQILVESAIKKLNYEPNMLGRNLRRSETRMILTLAPSISNPFYAKIIHGIENTARKGNYNILVCGTDSDLTREKVYLDLLKRKLADGVILIDTTIEPEVLQELGGRYPVIQCCGYNENVDIPYVSIDNTAAAYNAVKHLISLGHRKIAFINSDEKKFLYARLRKKGYLKAFQEFNLPVREEWLVNCESNFKNGINAMKYLLSLPERPTAVFAVYDMLAIEALRAIKEEGLKVPQDIAVIGFDNIPLAGLMNPTLTTIAQPMLEMGQAATQMLIERIKNKDRRLTNLILDFELIIRESTMG